MRKKFFGYMCLLSAATAILTAIIIILGASSNIETSGRFAGSIASCVLIAGLIGSALISRFMNIVPGPDEETEISPLLKMLDQQSSNIRKNESQIQKRDRGLSTIMENMNEGLLLLDQTGQIEGINKSACDLLNIPEGDYSGKRVFTANQNPMLQAVIHKAMGGLHGSEILDISGKAVQVLSNPVWVDGVVRGVVLLVFDVTANREAEQMRREFSANVSHELKTPLTSISGYAEIIMNGLAKPEDFRAFAGRIYNEAAGMINLIDDIIKLSRLDERDSSVEMEKFDLYLAAENIMARLREKAAAREVTLSLIGVPTQLLGNAPIVDEIIFNLLDNAINYNVPGGRAELSISETLKGPMLRVTDTGIGIPQEHQARVFERFYRADKSHSKETGGTGLGLSIVKHGALFHNADITLNSTPGVGTTIEIQFKAE